jgi:microcin C transport system ATP-binding protein
VIEYGRSEDVFEHPRTPYTRALMAAAFDLRVAEVEAVRQ